MSKIINGTSGSLTGYTATTTIDATADYFLIQQGGAGVYRSINRNNILGITGSPIGTSDSQTLTNKVIGITNTVTALASTFTIVDNTDNTKIAKFQASGITTGTTRTYTLPNASDTLVGKATTDTLTNKTITSPTITGGTYDNGTITVDSISGHTTPTIVTVGGVQMNNGVIGTSSAVVTASIADTAVTPAKLQTGAGSGWAWQSWTPTLTNMAIGTGGSAGVAASYVQTGKTVNYRIVITLGTSGQSVGSAPTFTLPVTANAANKVSVPIGIARFAVAGIGYFGYVWAISTTTAAPFALGTASTYANDAQVTAAIPGTWVASDYMYITGAYEAA